MSRETVAKLRKALADARDELDPYRSFNTRMAANAVLNETQEAPPVNTPHLENVTARIRDSIAFFCTVRLLRNVPDFHADDLRQHVEDDVGTVAPGSADRILRHMRQKGQLDYTVMDRAKSLYQVHWVIA